MDAATALFLVAFLGFVLGLSLGLWLREHRDELLPPAQQQAVDEIAPRPVVETKVVPQFGTPEVKASEFPTVCSIDGEDIATGEQTVVIPVRNSDDELHICLNHVHTGEVENA